VKVFEDSNKTFTFQWRR